MHKNIFYLFLVSTIFVLSMDSVYAERNCEYEKICVQSGDYLRYETTIGELLLEFTETLHDNKINFKWINFNQDGTLDSEQFYILDRSTGNYTINIFDQEMEVPLLYFLSKEIVDNYHDLEFCNETKFDFNGINRNVFECNNNDGGSTYGVVDIETGIIIQLIIKFGSIDSVISLIDTNIFFAKDFNASTSKPTPEPESASGTKSKIPSWIKNNAGWWADGSIDDETFVQGIQYLIKEGIMTIPDSDNDFETSSQIPEWIKIVAGFWAEDMISEDDFIISIQFLIENGIISV